MASALAIEPYLPVVLSPLPSGGRSPEEAYMMPKSLMVDETWHESPRMARKGQQRLH